MRKPPNEGLRNQARTPAKAGGQQKDESSLSPSGEGTGVGESVSHLEACDGPTPIPPPKGRGLHTPERKCILSGAHDARDNLIRLAISPEAEILPDVRAKAPGRGAWIGVDRAALETARANGKLRGALARAFKTGDLNIPDDLGERIETALRQAVLDRLGLEARAGTLLSGSEKIEVAARRGEVRLLLHAADAGEDGSRRLDQAFRVGECEGEPLVIPAERPILSLALGRQNVVHIALIDRAAAARVRHAIDRWRAFIGPDAGLRAATAGTPDASSVM